MKKSIPYIIIAALLIYIICMWRHGEGRGDPLPVRDTITYIDTIVYHKPVPKDSMVVKYISVTVPKIAENVQNDADSVPKIAEIVQNDSVSVQIPITQKVYEDSTYKAYVSGFQPNLDSIWVFPKRQVVTITPVVKPHRWHIGPSVGIGVTPKGFQPTIGITLTYSICSW